MQDEALLAEAMALVVLPYASLVGLFERAEALQRRAADRGDLRVEALARLARVDIMGRQQQVPESIRLAHEVLLWADDTGDRLVAARANALLSTGLWRLGAWAEAVPRGEQAVRLLDDDAPLAIQADHALIVALLNSLRAGPYDPKPFHHADELARRLGDPIMIIANLNNMAWTEYDNDKIDDAARTVREIRRIAADTGMELSANVLDTVAMVLLQVGNAQEAERLLLDAFTGHVAITEVDGIASMLMTYSEIKLREGDHMAALQAVERCTHLISGKQLGEVAANAARQLASVHAAMGDFRAAYDAMLDFTAKWQELRSLQAEASASAMQVMVDLDRARQESLRYQELAERDALTGLWNRRRLEGTLPGLLREPHRTHLALVDLDHFKHINDRFSHEIGDVVLREVAGLLAAEAGSNAFVVRLGGEEFVVVFVDVDDPTALARCESLRAAIQRYTWDRHAPGLAVTTSIGVAAARPDDTMPTLLRRADERLYRSKREGRNRVTGGPTGT